MLAAKRMREHVALFASVAGVTAILAGLGSGLLGYLTSALDDGVRGAIRSASGQDGALRLTLDVSDDSGALDALDERMRAVLDDVFRSGGRLPFEIVLSESAGQSVEITLPDGREPVEPPTAAESAPDAAENPDTEPVPLKADVVSIPDLPSAAMLVDGTWGAGAEELSMQADAAAGLGLSLGDHVTLGGGDFVLVGTWRVTDALDPRWFGEPLVSSGRSETGAYGPVVIDPTAWSRICIGLPPGCSSHDADWTLVPADDFGVGDLTTLARGWDVLRDALAAEFATSGRTSGNLTETATLLASRVDAVRAVVPVALLLFAAIGFVTLAALARLLTSVRADETTLLRSRGASVRRLVATTAVESAVVSVVGTALGVGAATAALIAITGDDGFSRSLGLGIVAIPALVSIVTIALVTGTAWRTTRQALRRDSLNETGRGRAVVGVSLVVLLTLAAAVSVSQFLLYGSPLSPAPGGGTQIDPVAVLAPALALVAIVLLALLAFPPLARAVALLSARDPGIARSLSARSVARRAQLIATPVVLVGLACGQLVVAGAYSATWETSARQTLEARLGAPVSIQGPAGSFDADTLVRIAETPGLGPVAPVALDTAEYGTARVAIVAATQGALDRVATDVGGLFPRDAFAAVPDTSRPAPVLPAGTTSLRLTATALGLATAPTLAVQLIDDLGNTTTVDLERQASGATADGSGTWEYVGDLPEDAVAREPWRVLSIDVTLAAVLTATSMQFVVSEITALGAEDATVDAGLRWSTSATDTFSRQPGVTPNQPGIRAALRPGDGGTVHLVPINEPAMGALQIPIVVTRALADAYRLTEGGALSLALPFGTGQATAQIVAIVPAIPGADNAAGVLLDLAWVRLVQVRDRGEVLPPERLWAAPTDAAGVLPALRETLPADARVATVDADPVQRMLGVAASIVWLGAAGTGLLALVAIATVAGTLLRSRAPDVVLLRALGVAGRRQARMRTSELAWISVFGLAVGVLAGGVVALLTIGLLARAAVPEPLDNLPTVLHVDPAVLGLALAAFALGIALVLVGYGVRVARQTRTLSMREELR